MSGAALVRPDPFEVVPLAAAPLAAWVPRFLGWFRYSRQRAPLTLAAYAQDLRSFLAFTDRLGVTAPRAVTFTVIELYLASLVHERGCKPVTSNRHRHALREFFKYLLRAKAVETNPVDLTYALRVARPLPTYLSIPKQEAAMATLAAVPSLAGRRDYALIATMLFAGLRVSEVVALRLGDLDLDAGVLRVTAGKGQQPREGIVIPRLRGILDGYLREVRPALVGRPPGTVYYDEGRDRWVAEADRDGRRISRGCPSEAAARRWLADQGAPPPDPGYVFVRVGATHRLRRAAEPLLTRSVFAVVRRALGLHPHALRHSFASRLRFHGAGLELIQEALGHASITTTTIYAHLPTAKRHDEVARYLEGS